MFAGPASLLDWLLALSGAAVLLVFSVGIRSLSARESRASRSSAFRHEMAIACALIHEVGVLARGAPAVGWAVAGIALYVLAMVMFLDALERMREAVGPAPVVVEPVGSGPTGAARHPWRRIDVAFMLAWAAGPLATHSPTLIVTAAIMIVWQLSDSRRVGSV